MRIVVLLSILFSYGMNPSARYATRLPLKGDGRTMALRIVKPAYACAPYPDSIAIAEGDSTTKLTRKNVWRYIKRTRMLFPHIVYKQAIMETALKSNYARLNNNLVCMTMATKRRTTAIGVRNGYAVYPTWQACINDYHIMQQRFGGSTEEQYYYFLRTYGGVDYVVNLKKAKVRIPE